ncbi:hypothetical protein SDC9_194989 [bioreactor metagenome]|uniref:Uncharacterized protein n=1 Tax=bioreactor metagenome TaxID=1076179 RepID=A0A645I7R7_9ZZZZ
MWKTTNAAGIAGISGSTTSKSEIATGSSGTGIAYIRD